jgi:hypothetical protein
MVESLPIANSPAAVAGIILVYLAFVTKIGPKLMEPHKPFNIKYVMTVYNLAQVFYNVWIVYLVSIPLFFLLHSSVWAPYFS